MMNVTMRPNRNFDGLSSLIQMLDRVTSNYFNSRLMLKKKTKLKKLRTD